MKRVWLYDAVAVIAGAIAIEYVTVHCRPAAMRSLAGLVVAACVSVAAAIALLVTVRGRRAAASI